jgi:hypothetical protein
VTPTPAGPFVPGKFEAPDQTPIKVEWQPGSVVRLEFGAGSVVETVPAIIMTGVVTGIAALFVAGSMGGGWLWVILAGAAAIAARTAIEKGQRQPRGVRFDWSAASLILTGPGLHEPIRFAEIKELVLRGHIREGVREESSSSRIRYYSCELVAVTTGRGERVIATSRSFHEREPSYEMMVPMASELAAAIPVPWRWEEFELPLSALIDRMI